MQENRSRDVVPYDELFRKYVPAKQTWERTTDKEERLKELERDAVQFVEVHPDCDLSAKSLVFMFEAHQKFGHI